MTPTIRTRILQAAGAAVLAAMAVTGGGGAESSHIRTATIGGVRGPVYYSVVDGTYHPVGRAIVRPGDVSQQVAEVLPPTS